MWILGLKGLKKIIVCLMKIFSVIQGFYGIVTNTSILLSYLIFNFPVLNIFGAMHLPTRRGKFPIPSRGFPNL